MSEITINQIIVHELIKKQHEALQESNTRDKVLDSGNEIVIKLLEGITHVYDRKQNRRHYGTFAPAKVGTAFPTAFSEYESKSQPESADLIDISLTTMTRLEEEARGETASSGGYILFADYKSTSERFFLVAMIKPTDGIRLTKNLEPEELTQLDLSKLHQAARINFSKYKKFLKASEIEQQELNYLSFVSPVSNQSAAGYFITALGCAPGSTSKQATETVIREARQFFHSNDDLKPYRHKFLDELQEHFHSKGKDSVTLVEIGEIARKNMPVSLGEKIEELTDEFLERLNGDELGVPSEFPPHQKTVHKYTHLRVQGSKWQFEFARDALGDTDTADIFFDRFNKRIIISDLPEDAINAIEVELNQSTD